ncbi:hypothetical protein POF50_018960 [Streptomyces sp. SL13]|uniref:Uncharacterized protein n=1 Tax=Streptantibioticus silvisoli TaxID=2705255 RepID=A0AA90HAY8_9ACTN|nr:hypothetical protein [Streptantibioticus silvisoli]MDI5971392.1 hypothetical protein [Streptantibioticus silvisoli]
MGRDASGGGVPDDVIYRRLMPSNGDGPPDPAQPGVGVADDPSALAGLKVSPSALRSAGQAAGRLGTGTRTARSSLEHAHEGLAKAAAGFSFAAAVAALHTSWDGRLGKITKDCDEIGTLCQDAAQGHESTDQGVRDSMTP